MRRFQRQQVSVFTQQGHVGACRVPLSPAERVGRRPSSPCPGLASPSLPAAEALLAPARTRRSAASSSGSPRPPSSVPCQRGTQG